MSKSTKLISKCFFDDNNMDPCDRAERIATTNNYLKVIKFE